MKGLLVPEDAGVTASNILAHENLYRAGLAFDLISNMLYVALTALFYRFFVPVNRNLSLVAAFFSLVGCTVQIFAGIFRLAPLLILGGGPWSSAFNPQQLQTAALLSLKLHSQSFTISLVLFAIYDFLLSILIYRSLFLPRILGAWMMLAGLGWLTFLWPPLAAQVQTFVMVFGGLAEVALMLWLLVKARKISATTQPVH